MNPKLQKSLMKYTIYSLMQTENSFNINRKSPAGARGLMQVMEKNFPKGTKNMDDPKTNIKAGISELTKNMENAKKTSNKIDPALRKQMTWGHVMAFALLAYNGKGYLDNPETLSRIISGKQPGSKKGDTIMYTRSILGRDKNILGLSNAFFTRPPNISDSDYKKWNDRIEKEDKPFNRIVTALGLDVNNVRDAMQTKVYK